MPIDELTKRSIVNYWYEQLRKNQINKIYQHRSRQIGDYLGIYTEKAHLDKYLITLSPIDNTIEGVIKLRKKFLEKLNRRIKYKKYELGYFTAIETALNKENPTLQSKVYELERLKNEKVNFHIHIQLFCNISYEELEKILSKLDITEITYKTITTPEYEMPPEYRYTYVVKELYDINWKLQYYIKNHCKNKTLYTSSQKSIPNYLITKLWDFMKTKYKDKWNEINDKYSFVLNSINKGNIILSSIDNVY